MQYTAIGRQLGYAGYMLCDNLAFLDALGAWKSERGKEMGVRAYQFWLVGLVCSVVGGVYKTAELRMRESEVNRSQGEGAVEMKMIQR
jgi:peroxin-11B